MKRITILLITILTLAGLYAQDSSSLSINGQLMNDERVLLKNSSPWVWNENRLELKLEQSLPGNAKFYGQVWVRNLGLPQIGQMTDLYNKGIVDPINLEIRQAYVQINNFVVDNLDLTVGRQIITWGTADKINPTDNLNPLDLEDVLDFGRRRGADALRLDYYLSNDWYVEAVAEPFFRPANLPIGVYADLLDPKQFIQLPQGLNMASFNTTLTVPGNSLSSQFIGGIKLKGFAGGFDFSLSYVYGRDYLPLFDVIDMQVLDAQGNTDVTVNFYYPRHHILGADFAGNIFGIGVWGEAAAFLPKDDIKFTTVLHTVDMTQFPPQPVTLTQDSMLQPKGKPYIKYVLGADYTFPGGVYANFQFVHGFLHERFIGGLNDYYLLRVEKSFFYDKLKIAPVSGAFVVSDYKDLKNNYTLLYMPQVIYKPNLNTEITLSLGLFGGKGSDMFSSLKDMDMLAVSIKYDF